MKSVRSDRLGLSAFGLSVLLAGFNAIGVRFVVMELPPFWGSAIRFVPAALILFLVVFLMRLPLPKDRGLLGAVMFGAINFGGSFGFLYWGLEKVQAGMAQLILSLVPLLTLLFAIVQRQEVFRWRALLGSLMAVIGIALVFSEQLGTNVPLLSLLAVVMGAVCFAEAGILVKRFPKSHPITTNAIGMAAGSAILLLISALSHEELALPVKPVTWIALIYLILFGTCVVFILFVFILNRWPASTASYQFVLLPFVTLSASAWLTQEELSPVLFVGAALVLVGVYLGAMMSPGKPGSPRSTQV